jgi:hypothetical protein
MDLFRRFPLTTLVVWATTVLGVLIVLQSSGVLTGTAAHWVDVTAGALQVVLTAYAKTHVTPVIDPKDNEGRELVPARSALR